MYVVHGGVKCKQTDTNDIKQKCEYMTRLPQWSCTHCTRQNKRTSLVVWDEGHILEKLKIHKYIIH